MQIFFLFLKKRPRGEKCSACFRVKSSLGRIMLKSQGLCHGGVPLFLQIFPTANGLLNDFRLPRRPLMVRAALLRRSCDGVAAATELLLRRICADQLRRAHSARRVRDAADAAATELILRAALLRRSRCCDGVAAATEMRRPAPSRSFCASRLDATR